MEQKRLKEEKISGHTKYPDFNDGFGIYEYTETGFLKSYSRFCKEAEKPWRVEKYTNNDFGLPIKSEMFLMGEYVRYDTYEYDMDNNMVKHSVYELKHGLSFYIENSYEDGRKTESRKYTKNGDLVSYLFREYDQFGLKSKITCRDLDGTINTESVFEYDGDILLARLDFINGIDSESECGTIRSQFLWEEKECSVKLTDWLTG